MKSRKKTVTGLSLLLGIGVMGPGCSSEKPIIPWEQHSHQIQYDSINLAVEPFDTPEESSRVYNGYDGLSNGFLPIHVKIQNTSQDKKLVLNTLGSFIEDNRGYRWRNAFASEFWLETQAKTEVLIGTIKGGLMGVAAPIGMMVEKPLMRDRFARQIEQYQEKTIYGEQVLYPQMILEGDLLFREPDNAKGSTKKRIPGSTLNIYIDSGDGAESIRKINLGEISDYRERAKNETQ
ncbi:MAG: hypothetical protein KC506_03225 [Nanoarchaeota archaeon]|nr:hypothetical protein [Nanoarchaeota archaeon]